MPNTVKRRVTNTQLIYFWILNLFHPTYSGGLKISPSILLWLSDLGLRCPFFFLLSYFTYSFIYLLSYFRRWLTSPCDSVFFTEYVPSSSSTIRVFLSRGLSGIYKHIKVSWKVLYIWSTVSWSISPQQCEVTDAYWQTAL